MDETTELRRKFFHEGVLLRLINGVNKDYAINIVNKFQLSQPQGKNTSPDFFCIDDDVAYIFEHFSFTSSEIDYRDGKSKGFKSTINENKITNEFHEFSKDKDVCSASYPSNAKQSAKQYIDNLINVFKSHYSRINKYKANVLSANSEKKIKTFVVTFIIEDRSLLPNIILAGEHNTNNVIPPIYCKEFLRVLYTSRDVDNVISCQEVPGEKIITFFNNDENGFENIYGGSYELKEVGIKEFNPQFMFIKHH